jgi:hypothetical protein
MVRRTFFVFAAMGIGMTGGFVAYRPAPAEAMMMDCSASGCPCLRCGANGTFQCHGAARGGYSCQWSALGFCHQFGVCAAPY